MKFFISKIAPFDYYRNFYFLKMDKFIKNNLKGLPVGFFHLSTVNILFLDYH